MTIYPEGIDGIIINGWTIGKKRKTITPYGFKDYQKTPLNYKDIAPYIIFIPDTIDKKDKDIVQYIAECYSNYINLRKSRNYSFDTLMRHKDIGIEKFLNHFDIIDKYNKEYILLIGKTL